MGEYIPSPVPLASTVLIPEDGEEPNGDILGGPHEVGFDAIAACVTAEHIGGVEGLGREVDGAIVFAGGAAYAGVRARIFEVANADQPIDAEADVYRVAQIAGGDKTLTIIPATSLLLGRTFRLVRAAAPDGEDDGLVVRADDGLGGFYTLVTIAATGVSTPFIGTWVDFACVVDGATFRWVVIGWGGNGITFDATNTYADGGT